MESCSFLSLRNRSRLPGKVPSWKQQPVESDEAESAEEKKLKLSLEIYVVMIFGSRIACGGLVRLMYCVIHVLFRGHKMFIYVAYNTQGSVRRCFMAWVFVVAWQIVFAEYEVNRNKDAMKLIDKGFITIEILLTLWIGKSVLVM
ncbi:unnamed protein product [Microthlaspi erraticum]|uniref:Uncharacterized protein n=1 Tax=Microthlaspi erraticum TaxID=1685480 RepID=A0A6D2KWU6_9BRAS|nr:unnamed protein product [Microthlaspi erraticum]